MIGVTPATRRDKCAGGGCRSETTYANHSSSNRARRDGFGRARRARTTPVRRSCHAGDLRELIPRAMASATSRSPRREPSNEEARTERGRIVFEDVPAGTYRLRFDREGFISLERELVARPGAPMDVKVTLTPAPPPPPPPEAKPAAPEPVAPPSDLAPVAIDLPSFIEKNYVGRAAGKTSAARVRHDRRRDAHPAARAARRAHARGRGRVPLRDCR